IVSKASDDLPEPERPVNTMSRLRGSSSETFFRLCSRAPLMTMDSVDMARPRAEGGDCTACLRPNCRGGIRCRGAGAHLACPTLPAHLGRENAMFRQIGAGEIILILAVLLLLFGS